MKKKIVSLALAIAMCFSLLTFTVPSAGAYEHSPTVSVFNGYCNALFDFVSATYQLATGGDVTSSDINAIASKLVFPRVGKVSYDALERCVEYYNASLYGHLNALIGNGKFQSRGAIRPDFENGIYRIYDHAAGHWVADSNGDFPYTLMDNVAGDIPAGEGSGSAGTCQWLSGSGNSGITNSFRIYSKEVLDAKSLELTNWGHPCSLQQVTIGPKGKEVKCWAIRDDYWYYYCDEDGNRLVALVEETITDDPRPSIDNSGNLIEGDNGLILDNQNGIFAVVDHLGNRFELDFDGAVWDFSSDSYTVNAYSTVNEGDNHYYTYYTYNIQYNITNTYITYIGSNEPYEREEYELYYQLPDGRSSADLTAEEVAGMSFEFYDVVNYQRSTDNVSVRGLYHFDGNTDDSSYFTGQGSFVWNDGASITYMDAGEAFEGALYLDNTAHAFDIVLPSNIGTKDFQVQFRHYQASEIDTQDNVENRLSFGDAVLSWDESSLYFQGSKVADLPIGTWHEIALTRYNGTFYVYLNGLRVGSAGSGSYSFGVLNFVFGSTSRAYTMIDELRILNICTIEGADYYSPTVVPYDSNLVLILPDEKIPIADSYYQVIPDANNLFGDKHDYTGLLTGSDLPSGITQGTSYGVKPSGCTPSGGTLWMDGTGSLTTASAIDGGVRFTGVSTWSGIPNKSKYDNLLIGLSGVVSANTTYTFTLVSTSGEKSSFTFTTGANVSRWRSSGTTNSNISAVNTTWASGTVLGASVMAGNVSCYLNSSTVDSYPVIAIKPPNGTSVDIAYMELVPGTSSDLIVEEVTAVYPGIELQPNTAAIQTVIPVNGYTVGGIRPSMPNRGDCWFPVMNNRITSVQIYTGTHWEEVNARWWTGSRWIPIYAFDINTLEDLFDIADGDSTVPLLPDQNAFLRWWQLQWLDFRNWLEGALSNGGGGTVVPDDDDLPGEMDDPATEDDDGWSFVDLLVKTKDGIWKITKGIVKTAAGGITGLVLLIEDAGDFFTPYEDGYSEGVGDLMNYGGDDIWD